MLSNPRHEAFAHGLAKGLGVDEAYVAAGFKSHSGSASRLNRTPRVVARVAELKEFVQNIRQQANTISVVREEITRDWVIEKLVIVVHLCLAKQPPDSAGANKALNLIGLDLGMFVQRQEIGKPGEFDGLTIAGKRERVLGMARQLGLDRLTDAQRAALVSPPPTAALIEHDAQEIGAPLAHAESVTD
jgi:phage terminase small subunit